MKSMIMLRMVRITASIRAKVACGPVPSIIGSGPKINTTPTDMGVSKKTADIAMKITPTKINRTPKRKSLKKGNPKTSDSVDLSLR